MKLLEFARRHRRALLVVLFVYLGLSLWLYLATRDASDVPFVYQVF